MTVTAVTVEQLNFLRALFKRTHFEYKFLTDEKLRARVYERTCYDLDYLEPNEYAALVAQLTATLQQRCGEKSAAKHLKFLMRKWGVG